MESLLIIGIVIAVLFLVLGLFSSVYSGLYDDMISGLWQADTEWANSADLDGMLLYVGPKDGFGIFSEDRKGYLIMYADDNVIASKQLHLNIGTGIQMIPSKTVNYNITIEEINDKETDIPEDTDIPFENIMPNNLEMELEIAGGKLILSGEDDEGETVQYAKLYKNSGVQGNPL